MYSAPNNRPQLLHLEHPTPGDHKRLEEKGGVQIGICEVNGNSTSRQQEDAYIMDVSPTSQKLMDMKPEERKRVAKATFATLQSEVKDQKDVGSCACVATGQVKENKVAISTSYVGDSIAVLVILHADGSFTSIPCNPELHDADNDKECVAIKKGYGERTKGVVGGQRLLKPRPGGGVDGIAVTRGMGDAQYDDAGISHVPQTTEIEYELKEGDVPFMFVGCDGTMEHRKGFNSVATFAKELGEVVSAAYKVNPSPEAIAEKVVDNALAKGSQDNITAMIVPLTKTAITAGVFDGHGGPQVAETLGRKYNEVVAEMVDNPNRVAAVEAEEKNALLTKQLKDVKSGNFEGLQTTAEGLQKEADHLFYQRPIDDIKACLDNLDNNYDDYKKKVGWVIKKFKEKYDFVNREGFTCSNDLEPLKEEFLDAYKQLLARQSLLKEHNSFENAGLKTQEVLPDVQKPSNKIGLDDPSENALQEENNSKFSLYINNNNENVTVTAPKNTENELSPDISAALEKARKLQRTYGQTFRGSDLADLVASSVVPGTSEQSPKLQRVEPPREPQPNDVSVPKSRKGRRFAIGGGVGGVFVGAGVGAAIGSAIFPGPGTAIGAVIGGIVGGLIGSGVFGGIGYYIERKGSSDNKERRDEATADLESDDKDKQNPSLNCNRSTRSLLEINVASGPGSHSVPEDSKGAAKEETIVQTTPTVHQAPVAATQTAPSASRH